MLFPSGTNANELRQVNNTLQAIDNFSKVVGRHTLKFGVEFHYDQINTNPIAQFNGNFLFTGSETGSDFADFLLGVPSQYNQSQLAAILRPQQVLGSLRRKTVGACAHNLTLNYGLRWDRIEPWYEKNNGISTFEPGKASVGFSRRACRHSFSYRPRRTPYARAPGNLDFAPRLGWPTRRMPRR